VSTIDLESREVLVEAAGPVRKEKGVFEYHYLKKKEVEEVWVG
jgi:quinol monooxygenase YgiN